MSFRLPASPLVLMILAAVGGCGGGGSGSEPGAAAGGTGGAGGVQGTGASGAGGAPCPAGQTVCDGRCVSTLTHAEHCGGCTLACAAGQACQDGTCTCPAGQVACGASCVDVTSSIAHCGACNVACPVGAGCEAGTCRCVPGRTECGGACVDLLGDGDHCGACDTACAAGTVCSSGACGSTCAVPGQSACGTSCVDVESDPEHCGSCDAACGLGEVCVAGRCDCPNGQLRCAGACVDQLTSPLHCGGCGVMCSGGPCVGGACTCPEGQELCSDGCRDTAADAEHCGACGHACGAGQSCAAGVCIATGSGGAPGTGGSGTGGATTGGAGGSATGGDETGGAAVGGSSTGGAATGGAASGGSGATTGGGAGAVNQAGYRWRSVRIGGGGFVSAVVASRSQRDLIFARTDVGGAYRWDEATQSWTAITDWVSDAETGFLGVEAIALDPSEPNRVYLLVGISYFNGGRTAILRSSDYGDTFTVTEVTSQFTAHGNGMGRQSGERLAVDPNNGSVLYCGTRQHGLFKSSDRGATWSRVTAFPVTTTANGNGIPFVVFDPSSGSVGGVTRTLYAGASRSGQSNLYRSTDGGATWSAIANQPTTYVPGRAALASNGALYVTYGNGAGPHGTTTDPMDRGAVYRFDPQSGSFTDVSPLTGSENRAFSGISVDASNPNRLVATTINTYWQQPWGWGDRVFVSTNGGTSWTDIIGAGRVTMDTSGSPWIQDHAIHWAGSVEIDPFDPGRVFLTSGNGIFMTDDIDAGSIRMKFAATGLEEIVPLDAVSLPGGPLVSVIGDYDGFVHQDPAVSPPAGAHVPGMGTTNGLAFAYQRPNLVARVGARLYVSTNGGTSWTEWSRPNSSTNGRLAFSADGGTLLWSVGNAIHRTTSSGSSWSQASGVAFDAFPVADTVNASTFYAYNPDNGAVVVSTNGGQSFASTTTVASRGSSRLRVAPGHEGHVWIALYGGGLTRSTNSASSFQTVSSVSSCGAVGFGAPAPGQSYPAVYIWGRASGGPSGIYRSDDSGASWVRINDDAHEYGGPGNGQFVLGDLNVYGRVYMSTAGRGIAWGELVE